MQTIFRMHRNRFLTLTLLMQLNRHRSEYTDETSNHISSMGFWNFDGGRCAPYLLPAADLQYSSKTDKYFRANRLLSPAMSGILLIGDPIGLLASLWIEAVCFAGGPLRYPRSQAFPERGHCAFSGAMTRNDFVR
jgi:hypothetical protein